MTMIPVRLKTTPYEIITGFSILAGLGERLKSLLAARDAVIITNPVIARHHGPQLVSGLRGHGFSVKVLEVPAGERSKSARAAFRLIEEIARYDQLKRVLIVAFGGGVVGDLAGYVAAAYKRGIPYVQVPTTLLAQVDSAIGGKVGIDLAAGKNLVGAFYQPKIVWSDAAVLSTLTKRQIRNGLAEVIKYGIIAERPFFNYVAANYEKVLACEPAVLSRIVEHSSRIKRDVIVADERETKGIREVLNFGHTVGHAIEAAGGYGRYHHGEAVALGMRVAAQISCLMRLCGQEDVAAINDLLSRVGLPEKIRGVRTEDILRAMRHDKKFIRGKNRFVLMARIGKVTLVEGVAVPVIKKSIEIYQS